MYNKLLLNFKNVGFLCFILLLFCSVTSFSQGTYILRGTIYDASDKDYTLPRAHAIPECDRAKGTASDDDGKYQLEINQVECEIRFQFVGYETQIKKVSFHNSRVINLDIYLSPDSRVIEGVSIIDSKYEIKKDESVSSMEFVSPKTIENQNITSLDNAFDQVGGLIIVDNEPQMRGGSGFSSGMGSRVMIMMDEMPVLRVDAGRPAWNLIPMENIEQIEVLKGAASVLYGSSAITGAINVRTAYPRGKPQTRIILYNGFYSRPKEDYRCSWEKGTVPLTYGANISHSRKFKKFDLVLSAEYTHDDGFVGQELPIDTTKKYPEKYEKIIKEDRFRFNFGTRYHFKEGVYAGINGNFMYSQNTMTHFWLNADSGMYRTFPGSLTELKDFMFFVDPYFKYFSKKGGAHSLKGRFMYSDNWATNNQDSKSEMYYLDYQYNKKFKKAGNLELFTGIVGQFARSLGNVFSGVDDTTDILKPKYSANGAIYVQLEKRFLKKENLILLAGGRYEYYQIFEEFGYLKPDSATGNYAEAKPVFRAGVNYEIVETKTFIRASYGMGYRFPSIGERYITTIVGNYGFYPNPDLKSETSWNVELGVQQMFKLLDFQGFIDVAGYYQRYNNYVEFFFGPWLPMTWNPVTNPDGRKASDCYGFKFFNTGPARIAGVDLTLGGEGKMGKHIAYTVYFAYAYTNPKVMDTGFVFTETSSKKYNYNNTSSDTTGQIMKYRIEHILKADIDFKFFNIFSIGASAQYYSLMKNIDQFFYSLDPENEGSMRWVKESNSAFPFKGLADYQKEHQKGTWIFGLRTSVELWNVKLSLIVSNLFNKEYVLRPMSPEAPRLTTIQLMYKFTEGEPMFPKRKKNNS